MDKVLAKTVTVPWAVVLSVAGLLAGTGIASAGGAATREGDLAALSSRIDDVSAEADRHLVDALAARDVKLDAVLAEVRALREEVHELRAEGRGR